MRPGEVLEVAIERLGSQGDGLAVVGRRPVFVPLALPGERLRVRVAGRQGDGVAARALECLEQAPRAAPPCPHFGACGGCRLQHLPAEGYRAWLRAQVADALARRGLGDAAVEPAWVGASRARRRVRLAFAQDRDRCRLGLRVRSSHTIVDLASCVVALPAIEALLGPLRDLLAALPMARPCGEAQVTATDSGLDLLLTTPGAPGLDHRERLAGFADRQDLARIAWEAGPRAAPEPIAARRPVRVTFGGVPVALPPGAFLQATQPAEDAMRAAVEDALGDAVRVADLYAGCGTFALPLAARGREVHALESDAAMLDALAAAARARRLPVRAEARDLERQPLAGGALARLEGAVLDPPRAGARRQALALAQSAVARLAMVSCNPATFARDARILVDGGYRMRWVRPIDAFLWSGRVELVAAFHR